MPPLWVWPLFCYCGCVCSEAVQSLHLTAVHGETVTLPCNGSAYVGESIRFQWEAMGADVTASREDVLVDDRYANRVRFASEIHTGDWSILLMNVTPRDSNMYECIWDERRTLSTVWLSVLRPQVDRVVEVHLDGLVQLPCYLDVSRNQSPFDFSVWWEKDGFVIAKREHNTVYLSSIVVEDLDYLHPNNTEKFFINLRIDTYELSGYYHCWYRSKKSDDPKPGFPGTIKVVVLGLSANTENTTEEWGSTSFWPFSGMAESTTVEMPVLLDLVTQPVEVNTEPRPMEAVEDTATSFPEEDPLESSDWSHFPWVRTGLIAGVLLVTSVVLCILGALCKL